MQLGPLQPGVIVVHVHGEVSEGLRSGEVLLPAGAKTAESRA